VQEVKVKNLISFVIGLFLLFNLSAILLLLLVYISVYINPNKLVFLAFIGMGYPVILAINLIFIAFWIFVRIKYSLLSFLFIIIGWNHVTRLIEINQKTDIESDNKTIKILSYNVQNFVRKNVSNTQYIDNFDNQARITRFINDQKADIICLQEILYDRGDVQNFAEEFGKKNKTPNFYSRNYHQKKNPKLDGIAIFTRFPVINKGYIEHDDKTIGIFNDLIIYQDTFRLYNLHLASIHFRKEEYDFIGDLPNQEDQEVIKKHSLQVISKIKTAFIKRGSQVDIVERHIRNSPYPVIICGDFNDTPSSYAYRKIASGLTDAFVESGRGFGVTYAGESFPSFRIDYIFHDKYFESRRFTRHKVTYSDHYPVSCTLVIEDKPKE
jgi:endonuclease/exonuclease/phosphatase family metal-dependent hydrolase